MRTLALAALALVPAVALACTHALRQRRPRCAWFACTRRAARRSCYCSTHSHRVVPVGPPEPVVVIAPGIVQRGDETLFVLPEISHDPEHVAAVDRED